MPCYDPGPDDAGDAQMYRSRCDDLTRLLCEACKMIEEGLPIFVASDALSTWWENHKKFDKERGESGPALGESERTAVAGLAKAGEKLLACTPVGSTVIMELKASGALLKVFDSREIAERAAEEIRKIFRGAK